MQETNNTSRRRVAKRKAKDSVFEDLFSDPKYLLELYKVLHPEDTFVTEDMLEYVTIENVISNGAYNDLGFTVRDKRLILLEAQSTYTVNIVVRILFYLAETWKRHIINTDQDNYHSKKLDLPVPEFYVIFSGIKANEDSAKYPTELSLRNSFFPDVDCPIDLTVKMLYGEPYPDGPIDNRQGDIIWEFVTFCKVFDEMIDRDHCDREDLFKVVETCRKQNVLSEYLAERKTEVIDIMSFLFTQEEVTEMRIRRERREQAEETAKETAKKTAKKMLRDERFSHEDIAKFTGLKLSEVKALEETMMQDA